MSPELRLKAANSGINKWESRKTMNFFPHIEVPSSIEHSGSFLRSFESFCPSYPTYSSVAVGERPVGQMTMFYGGQVIVINDCPADKAKEIMLLASQASLTNTRIQTSSMGTKLPPESNTMFLPVHCGPFNHLSIANDVPLARRASLHRFLAKRKDRIASNAPYQTTISPKSDVPAKTWLALSSNHPSC